MDNKNEGFIYYNRKTMNNIYKKEETMSNKDNSEKKVFKEKIYKRRDNAILNPYPSNYEIFDKAQINSELMMFQQMCMISGTQYSLCLATQYLNKIGINICETDVKNMYLNKEINFISDYREDNKTMLENFLKKRET